jgi:hypothetical protein
MNTIEIKTDLSGEELQVLIWELEAFCEGKRLPKPVLRQPHVSGSLPLFKCKCGYETSNSVAWCTHADCCNGNDR